MQPRPRRRRPGVEGWYLLNGQNFVSKPSRDDEENILTPDPRLRQAARIKRLRHRADVVNVHQAGPAYCRWDASE